MDFIKKNLSGILVCFIIAVPAWLLGKAFPGHRRSGHCNSRRNAHHIDLDR